MTKKIKLKISARLLKKKMRKQPFKSKQCRFCNNDNQIVLLDYKNATFLKGFLTERGKVLPSRISGTCCLHQRKLATEIKRARVMGLVPYCSPYF